MGATTPSRRPGALDLESLLDPEPEIVSQSILPSEKASFFSEDFSSPAMKQQLEDTATIFGEIPKEEVLAAINDQAFDCLYPAKPVQVSDSGLPNKRMCEKIALKGAVFGEIEFTSKGYLLFTPSKKKRPESSPYCLGALVNS